MKYAPISVVSTAVVVQLGLQAWKFVGSARSIARQYNVISIVDGQEVGRA